MSAEGNLPPQPPRRSGRGGAIVAALIAAFVVGIAGVGTGFFLGSRRAVAVVESPSREGVAFVLEGRCAAGTCQTLWVGPDTKKAKRVQSLSGPSEVAGEIAWTPDGSKVAFIVNGYQLRLFDAKSGAALGALAIIDPDGFPTSRIARGVTFSSNGAAITYDDCPRDHSGCKPGLLAIKQ